MGVSQKIEFHIALPIAIISIIGLQTLPMFSNSVKTIKKIEVIGSQKQSQDTIISKAGLKNIDNLDTTNFTEALNQLWATNLFDDIKFETIEEKEFLRLIIRVSERPVIKEVKYHSNKQISISDIKKAVGEHQLTIKPGSIYDPEVAHKIKNFLIDLALEKGFMRPAVDIVLEPTSIATSCLVFNLQEGTKVKINTIDFIGNKAIDQSHLRSAVAKNNQGWLMRLINRKEIYTKKYIDGVIDTIKNEYWKKGYKDIVVGQPYINIIDLPNGNDKKTKVISSQTNIAKRNCEANLIVPIIEGDLFIKGVFKAEGDDKELNALKMEELYNNQTDKTKYRHRLLPTKTHTKTSKLLENSYPFNLYTANQCIENIMANYRNNGYVDATCDVQTTSYPADGNKVNMTLNITKGSQFAVRQIHFEGNATTKDKVLRRSIMLKEGEIFKPDKMNNSLTQLSQLGHFKPKEPNFKLIPETSQIDIGIRGEEVGSTNFTFRAGYGSATHFSLGGAIFTNNLFGGGQSLGLEIDTSKNNKILSITHTEPHVLDSPYAITTSLSREHISYNNGSDDNTKTSNNDRRNNHTIDVASYTQLSTFMPNKIWPYFTTCSIGYRFQKTHTLNKSDQKFQNNRSQLISSLYSTLTYDTTNDPIKPTDGQMFQLSCNYAGWQLGTDCPFIKTTAEYKRFVSIANRSVLYFKIDCGYIKFDNKSDAANDMEIMFKPGGINSIRGYLDSQVGPTVKNNLGQYVFTGGTKQLIANFEYQFQLASMAKAVMFYDIGQAWRNKESRKDFRQSIGAELRIFVPILPVPLRFIWARKLNPYKIDKVRGTNFEFNINTAF